MGIYYGVNRLNKILWGMVKVAIYCMIVMGIVGLITVFIVIPQWVKSTEVLVPNIIGKRYYQAAPVLSEVGLKIEKPIIQASSSEPKGNVIEQDPPANSSIKPHHPVKITVSIGAILTPIPSVIGKSEDAAYETLQSAGFRTNSIARVHSTTYLPDTVIAQNPIEGTEKEHGHLINLLVSMGRKPETIKLPNLKNQPINDVIPALEAIGLSVEIKNGPHPTIENGKIIRHDQLVQIGDLITLEVSGKRDNTENSGKWLTHKHTVTQEGNRARIVKIIVADDYRERKVLEASYAPGTVIDLEKSRIRVFGSTLVIVFENGKKLYERQYQ